MKTIIVLLAGIVTALVAFFITTGQHSGIGLIALQYVVFALLITMLFKLSLQNIVLRYLGFSAAYLVGFLVVAYASHAVVATVPALSIHVITTVLVVWLAATLIGFVVRYVMVRGMPWKKTKS
jgi:hypothetical protein